MGLILPYSFTGGTSAKAQEVNANFIAVQAFVDNLETVTNGFINRYNLLDSTKANINGSENQQFAVAPATTDNQAISLAQLNERMLPFITIVNGLRLSKLNNYQFVCGVGGCYDSLYKYPIANQSTLTGDVSSYPAASDGYAYIWILARISDPSETSLALTDNGSQPTLIYDDTIYRQIGYVSIQQGIISDIYNI